MKLDSGSTKPCRSQINQEKLKEAANCLLDAIEGLERRKGTKRTPERIARDWGELFEGYNYDVDDILNRTFDNEKYDELILINTNFTSTCEHHILPFRGTAWVGYVPNKRIVGLDKIVKLVWMFSRRLQNQERITKQIAETIQRKLKPMGVMVVLKATHDCISLRGTGAVSETITSACFGIFREKAKSREEFLSLIKL